MTAATDYLEDEILKKYFIDSPTFIALYAADPGDAMTASTEITGGSYVRKAGTWTLASGTVSLSAAVVFSGMPACTVNGWAIMDGVGGGAKALVHGPLTASKTLAAGDALSFDVGALTVSCD